jgi:hypothetical protein
VLLCVRKLHLPLFCARFTRATPYRLVTHHPTTRHSWSRC